MSDTMIGRMFYEDRFPNSTWRVIFLLLYSPVGILIAMIRMCMVLQAYIAASLLRSQVSIRRFILRIVCCALGIIFEEDESECKRNESARLLVSNHVSIFDYIPIHLLSNCQTFVHCDVPDWLLHGIGLKSISIKTSNSSENIRLSVLRSELKAHKDPVLLFPEKETTNGSVGLLKFDSWWTSEAELVQPIAIYLRRPSLIDIKPSVLGSAWYSDYFWSFFVPYTIYTVKYLPVIEKNSNECNEDFADRIQSAIAEKMGIAKTKFTAADKMEYEKRYIKDKHRNYILNKQSMIMRNHRDLQKMVIQVSEVLPHVPRDVIFRDLEVTGNVDVTITNILEGKVSLVSRIQSENQNTPEVVAGPSSASTTQSTASSSNITKQHMTFQERKAKLIEDARRRYKEKHNLS